jgi:quercetin dioxygenase-like cupin family protein
MAQAYFKRGAIVPMHADAGETTIYVLQGALRVHVEADLVTVREGDLLIVPSGANHQAEALDDTFLLTVRSAPHGPT